MRVLAFLGIVMLGVFGCGRSQSVVSGSVHVNNRPIQRGHLTFFPLEGTDRTRGVEVTDGAYRATDMPPGKWRVLLTETPDVEVVKKNDATPVLKMRGVRNNQPMGATPPLVVEIRSGNQMLDLVWQNSKK